MEKPEFLGTNVAACLVIINAVAVGLAGVGILATGGTAIACNVPAAAWTLGASWSA